MQTKESSRKRDEKCFFYTRDGKLPKVFVFVFARDHNLKAFDVEQNFYRCVGVCITMGNKVEGKMKYVQRYGSPAGFKWFAAAVYLAVRFQIASNKAPITKTEKLCNQGLQTVFNQN